MNRNHDLHARFPRASQSFLRLNPPVGAAPAALVECGPRPGPLGTAPAEEGDSGRVLVRVTSYRRRLLDEDNLCEKYVVDCCRYAGLLHADTPAEAHIEVRQIKVKGKENEGTLIELNPLP